MATGEFFQRDKLKLKIKATMKKFKYQDLMNQVESVFAVTSKELKSMMSKYKTPYSKESLIQLILYCIRDFEVHDLQQRLIHLDLIAKAHYSHRWTWVALSLVNEMKENRQPVSDCPNIKRNIERLIRTKGQNAFVYIVEHDGLFWCAVAMKKLTRKKGTKLQLPWFFVFDLSLPYVFITTRRYSQSILKVIASSLNYENTKPCHLSGKAIKSMMSMIKTRNHTGVAHQPLDYCPAAAEIGERHVDFTQSRERKKYVDKCFDEHSVCLQTFTVEANTEWRGVDAVPEFAGNEFNTTMKLRSQNVSEMIKHMVSIGMMKVPLPSYVEDLPYRARNHMVLKGPRSQKDH